MGQEWGERGNSSNEPDTTILSALRDCFTIVFGFAWTGFQIWWAIQGILVLAGRR